MQAIMPMINSWLWLRKLLGLRLWSWKSKARPNVQEIKHHAPLLNGFTLAHY